jgi:hypothetical protein
MAWPSPRRGGRALGGQDFAELAPDRWQAYLDANSELVFYCPDCAEREFGSG